jgi:hypothetical protein
VPAITDVFAREIVPEVLMGPPCSPVPVKISVTVPVARELIITFCGVPDREIPEPAAIVLTPIFETVTLPVAELTEMPLPAMIEDTPPPPPPVEDRVPS